MGSGSFMGGALNGYAQGMIENQRKAQHQEDQARGLRLGILQKMVEDPNLKPEERQHVYQMYDEALSPKTAFQSKAKKPKGNGPENHGPMQMMANILGPIGHFLDPRAQPRQLQPLSSPAIPAQDNAQAGIPTNITQTPGAPGYGVQSNWFYTPEEGAQQDAKAASLKMKGAIDTRKQAVLEMGDDPASPRWRDWILTGTEHNQPVGLAPKRLQIKVPDPGSKQGYKWVVGESYRDSETGGMLYREKGSPGKLGAEITEVLDTRDHEPVAASNYKTSPHFNDVSKSLHTLYDGKIPPDQIEVMIANNTMLKDDQDAAARAATISGKNQRMGVVQGDTGVSPGASGPAIPRRPPVTAPNGMAPSMAPSGTPAERPSILARSSGMGTTPATLTPTASPTAAPGGAKTIKIGVGSTPSGATSQSATGKDSANGPLFKTENGQQKMNLPAYTKFLQSDPFVYQAVADIRGLSKATARNRQGVAKGQKILMDKLGMTDGDLAIEKDENANSAANLKFQTARSMGYDSAANQVEAMAQAVIDARKKVGNDPQIIQKAINNINNNVWSDPNLSALQVAIQGWVSAYGKGIVGGQMGNAQIPITAIQDAERIMNPAATKQTFAAIVNQAHIEMDKERQSIDKTRTAIRNGMLKPFGYYSHPEWFEGGKKADAEGADAMVKVQLPGHPAGQIPKSKLQQFQKDNPQAKVL